VDDAARAAALATGCKVKIDNYARDRDGISVASLAEVGFAYMKVYGAGKVMPEPGKPQGYEETGSVSSAIPGLGFTSYSSNAPNHTYEMETDALGEVGHHGFQIDAQAMTALLFDVALTRTTWLRSSANSTESRLCSRNINRRWNGPTRRRRCRIRSERGTPADVIEAP
jgi:hypothetical protein